ncbi:mucin-5AC-like [Anopheles albimanus]|uniref:mucin-5AC-like n=1 Tax=Anopheles albimanus TaxID=7167 RepID=UPI00163F1A86|nr:mucin-5AC-like [Anopheles albimanus]
MAFKMVVLFAALAYASAGYIDPAEHHHQVAYAAPAVQAAHYSSAPAVSYSSITRHDTPKVAVAKTVAYAEPAVQYAAAPAITKTVAYAEPSVHYAAAPALTKTYAVHEPALKTVVAQPAYTKTIYAQQPAAHVYAHSAPVVAAKTVTYAAPQVHYQAPALVKNVEYSKTLAYAPVAKTYVSQPTYTKTIVSEPAYTKTVIAQPQPTYTKTIVSEPAYTKTLIAQPQPLYHHSSPVYAQAAPVVAAKTLTYAEPSAHVSTHVSYADNSAHYAWTLDFFAYSYIGVFTACLALASAGYIEHYQGATSYSSIDHVSGPLPAVQLVAHKPAITYAPAATVIKTQSTVTKPAPITAVHYTAPLTKTVTYTSAPVPQYASAQHYYLAPGHTSDCSLKEHKLVAPAYVAPTVQLSGQSASVATSQQHQGASQTLLHSYPAQQTYIAPVQPSIVHYTPPKINLAPAKVVAKPVSYVVPPVTIHKSHTPFKVTQTLAQNLQTGASWSGANTGYATAHRYNVATVPAVTATQVQYLHTPVYGTHSTAQNPLTSVLLQNGAAVATSGHSNSYTAPAAPAAPAIQIVQQPPKTYLPAEQDQKKPLTVTGSQQQQQQQQQASSTSSSHSTSSTVHHTNQGGQYTSSSSSAAILSPLHITIDKRPYLPWTFEAIACRFGFRAIEGRHSSGFDINNAANGRNSIIQVLDPLAVTPILPELPKQSIMAFKFVVFLASLAVASAGYLEAGHAVQYAAPVAHYSSAPSVSYSSISQAAPVAKTIAYAAPVAKTISYAAPQVYAAPAQVYAHAAPVAKTYYSAPAVGATHESTVRSHDATVSHFSKTVDTPYSSVHKSDTRITNELPKLAYAKQLTYAAPAYQTYAHAAPAYQTTYAAPAVQTYAHAAPAYQTTYAAPAVQTYSHAAPAIQTYSHAAPAIQTYSHAAPVVAAHATKTLTYSPAVQVSHATYEDAHAHYAW